MKKITKKQTVNRLEEYIPKGCRKPRTRIVQEVVSLSINKIDPSEAPVAFACHGRNLGGKAQLVRLYKGKYYVQEIDYQGDGVWTPTKYQEGYLSFSWMRQCYDLDEEYLSEKDERKQRESFANKLIIGDYVYRRCGQPYYGWSTFGVGVSWCFSVCIPEHDYKDYEFRGISPDDTPMLQRKYDELMRDSARECSYKSLDDALQYDYIEVLMPECCKRKFQSPIYEGDKWYKNNGEMQKELAKDLAKCAERLRRKYAAHFEYLSNSDFAWHFDSAADVVRQELSRKVG